MLSHGALPPVGGALFGPAVRGTIWSCSRWAMAWMRPVAIYKGGAARARSDVDGEKEVARHSLPSVAGSKKCACVMSSVTVPADPGWRGSGGRPVR